MPLTVTVTPGYSFSESEKVTYPKLNLLGTPNIFINGTVGSSEIGDSVVTAAKLANNIDLSAKLADDSIPLSKLVGGDHGSVLYCDANGDWQLLTPGSDGQFLKTQGAGANPAWANQTGISSVPITMIVTAGSNKFLSTDGSGTIQWETKLTGQVTGVAQVYDQKATNTSGGTSQTSATARDLNAIIDPDSITGGVASNQLTLAAGKWAVDAAVPGDGCNRFTAWLYDTTGAATLLNGTSARTLTGDRNTTHSFIRGVFTLGAESVLEIRMQAQSSVSDGLGPAANIGTQPEIYTTMTVYRLSS